jgi:hypothetical protein
VLIPAFSHCTALNANGHKEGCTGAVGEEKAMDELTTTNHRSSNWRMWVNAAVILFLLAGVLLGITQLFIVLLVYSIVVAPV